MLREERAAGARLSLRVARGADRFRSFAAQARISRAALALLGLVMALIAAAVTHTFLFPDSAAMPLPANSASGARIAVVRVAGLGAQPSVYAFAKASPLTVYDSAELGDGRKESFEFGKAYEANEETPDAVRLKLGNGKFAYVRSAHVTLSRIPQWLTTTPGYNNSDRPKIRFWESPVKLNEFLSGGKTLASQWDYEEFFQAAPDYPLSLPITGTDSLELLGGSRQVKVVSVMLPIAKDMYQKFEQAGSNAVKPLDVHLLVDVSGSTKGFLEPAMTGLVKALSRNEQLQKRISSMTVTAFGASRFNRSSFMGKVSLKGIDSIGWYQPGMDQTTSGEREPLIEGLVTMQSNIVSNGTTSPVLLVLSGADVELSSFIKEQGKQVAIEDLDLKFTGDSIAIFTQITPEPSEDLRGAAQRLRKFARVRYIEYSAAAAEEAAVELGHAADPGKSAPLSAEAFAEVAAAAREKRMMAFLPRILTVGSSLPARQNYEVQADWYTVRLWLTLDPLLWKETTR
ncbi:MAG: hypothetical protein ACLPIX_03890 [Rhodomicrobium sp.]